MEYDNTINVGSLITAYHKGYHILTRIEFRGQLGDPNFENTPIFHYVKVLNDNGTISKGKANSCNAGFCEEITIEKAEDICQRKIDEAVEQKIAMMKYLAS